MKKKSINWVKKILLFYGLALLIFSCENEPEISPFVEETSTEVNAIIAIEEVKAKFQKNYLKDFQKVTPHLF